MGVSGGKDSVSLLDVLIKGGFQCVVAHCNFHLRSEESMRDEVFVRTLSSHYNIPYYKIDFETLKHADSQNISIEMAARDLRYEWFEKLRQKLNAQAIAVGHHADDNVETMLLNLIRGTGLKGLTGMQLRNGYIVRPFLSSSRSEIKDYVQFYGLKSVEDSTNLSTDILRNKIRHQLIPLMEEINPAFRRNISETRKYLSDAYGLMQREAERVKKEITKLNDTELIISIPKLQQIPEKDTLLFELLSPKGFNSDQIGGISAAIDSPVTGRMFESGTQKLVVDRDRILVRPITENNFETLEISEFETGIIFPVNLSFRIFEKDDSVEIPRTKDRIFLDAGKITFPLQLRKWKHSDFFYPLGMKMKKKKISDYLIDEKIDRLSKEIVLVLLSDNNIAWVVGHRIDERYKVIPETRRILEIRLQTP